MAKVVYIILFTKRGLCKGKNSKISWTQVETGSAITWKYPSCILKGDNSIGEFYSVAITNNFQQAEYGYKDDAYRKKTLKVRLFQKVSLLENLRILIEVR